MAKLTDQQKRFADARLVSSPSNDTNLSRKIYQGLLTNLYADLSGRDSITAESWFAGVMSDVGDGNSAENGVFAVRYGINAALTAVGDAGKTESTADKAAQTALEQLQATAKDLGINHDRAECRGAPDGHYGGGQQGGHSGGGDGMSIVIKTETCNTANYKSAGRAAADIRYIVVHFTGNRGDTAKNNADYFANNAGLNASANYFVDENDIYLSVDPKNIAWHCGTKGTYYHPYCRNANSIGVEICMLDKTGNVRQGSIDHAAELVRSLMSRYSIDTACVVRHYDVTHKDCPAPMVESPARWTAFKASLTAAAAAKEDIVTQDQFNSMMSTYLANLAKQAPSEWGAEARAWAEKSGVIKGDQNGNKEYKAFCTREQMAQCLYWMKNQ